MTKRDLEELLRKLQALGDDSDSPESKTALAIRAKLMAQHGITEEQIDERDWRKVKIARGTEMIACAVADWMKLDLRGHKATRKIELFASKREAKVFADLYDYSRKQFRAVQASARRAVKGWLLGHLHGLYPREHDPVPCPKCGEAGWGRYVDRASSRIKCEACGHLGEKLDFDPNSYFLARSLAHPALPGPAAGATPPQQIATEGRSCGNCRFAKAGIDGRLCWLVSAPLSGRYVAPGDVCGWHHFADEPRRARPLAM